jgi:hypothetical protein
MRTRSAAQMQRAYPRQCIEQEQQSHAGRIGEHRKEDEIVKDVSLITYTVADPTKAKRFFSELIGADPMSMRPGTSATRAAIWKSDSFRAEIHANRARSLPPAARSCKRLPTLRTDCWSPASKTRRRDRRITTTAEGLRDTPAAVNVSRYRRASVAQALVSFGCSGAGEKIRLPSTLVRGRDRGDNFPRLAARMA